jgi:hypothetical protein
MAQKKKLQVFVSSTYTDLREERQAAVEAILTAGHIPAGMELFTAGDESQMNVIKRWIDESDVYLLILGGRYGSLEQKSQKSYIHLEYEYAVEKGKPFFAVVIDENYADERVNTHPLQLGVIERDNPQKLKEFRAQVLTKVVRHWKDPKDIKLAILEKMAEFSNRDDLIGWIPGDEAVNTGAIAEEIARLGKENAALREQLAISSQAPMMYQGLTFDQMYKFIAAEKVDLTDTITQDFDDFVGALQELAAIFDDSEVGLLHFFWMMRDLLGRKKNVSLLSLRRAGDKLEDSGLATMEMLHSTRRYGLTETGKQFLIKLKLEKGTEEAEKYMLRMGTS